MSAAAFNAEMNETAFHAHIAKSLQICRDGFPDLYFGTLLRRDCISIANPGLSFRFIRLRSTASGVLHLKYIEVFATIEGKKRNIAPAASISVSSQWPGSESMVRARVFLKPHDAIYGFHTKDEPEPWAIVELDMRALVDCIVIHNRTDQFGPRAWSLAVDVSDDGLVWQEIYGHRKREAQFEACLRGAALLASAEDITFRQRCLLDELLVHLLRLEYREAVKRLLAERPDPDVKRQVLAGMNALVVRAQGAEWINHGIKRTFRFWSDEQKKKYLRDAVDVLSVLAASDANLEACLGYGAVLALLRDQGLMEHDDDLDIIVCARRTDFGNMAAFIDKVCTDLSAAGYLITGDFVSHRHASKDGMEPLDIFFGFQEGEFVSWLPGPRRAILRDEVFPPIECPLLGIDVSIPRNPFRYTAKVYGEDWAQPQPSWNHAWDTVAFQDWF